MNREPQGPSSSRVSSVNALPRDRGGAVWYLYRDRFGSHHLVAINNVVTLCGRSSGAMRIGSSLLAPSEAQDFVTCADCIDEHRRAGHGDA